MAESDVPSLCSLSNRKKKVSTIGEGLFVSGLDVADEGGKSLWVAEDTANYRSKAHTSKIKKYASLAKTS